MAVAKSDGVGGSSPAPLTLLVIIGGILLASPIVGASNQETPAEPSTITYTFEGEFMFLAEMEFEVFDSDHNSILLVNQNDNTGTHVIANPIGNQSVEGRANVGPISIRMQTLEVNPEEYSHVTFTVQYVLATEVFAIAAIAALVLSASRRIQRFLRRPRYSTLSSVEQKNDFQQDKPTKGKKRVRSVFGALFPIPWQGAGVMALDLCWELWALIQIWGNEDNGIEVRSDAEDEAFKVVKEEVLRIEEQLEQEFADDIFATLSLDVDKPSRWAIREAELRDSSCVFQLLNEANKSSDAEVKGRAQNVIDKYVDEFEPWKKK